MPVTKSSIANDLNSVVRDFRFSQS